IDEPDETFVVHFANPVNANIVDADGVATIIDDDLPPTLSVDSVSRAEGDSGSISFIFPVRLSAASGKTVTVNFATADSTATSSGSSADYGAAGGSLTFAPGETSKSISVAVYGDTRKESDERFYVQLSGAFNAAISDFPGIGTILNDDKTQAHVRASSFAVP